MMAENSDVRQSARPRGRFAPSPTGELHLGNARTALLAWLSTRSRGGSFILRMEDLDPVRSGDERARGVLADLAWLGLDWDEGPDVGGPHAPYTQSQRQDRYAAALARLAGRGLLYPCYCSRAEVAAVTDAPNGPEGPRYPGSCRSLTPAQAACHLVQGRSASVRLLVEPGEVAFRDGVKGMVAQDVQGETGDFVVRRFDGVVSYQLAVVVDDIAMEITEVVRGDDLILSTPRQIYLYRLLGAEPPVFVHVPLVRGHDGRRLAKRHGDISLRALREKGISAEAVIGRLAYLSGLVSENRPVRPQDLVAGFSLERLNREDVLLEPLDLLPRPVRRRQG